MIMKLRSTLLLLSTCSLWLLLQLPDNVSSFALVVVTPATHHRRSISMSFLSMAMADDDDEDTTPTDTAANYEPYFQMQQIPTATTTAKLDHIVHCAENGEMCDVEEMMEMMEELERLNLECTDALSRECSLDAVAARNVLKVALAANVAASECNIAHLYYDDPYAEMAEMQDECLNSKMTMHRIPTATATVQQKLDHIVECAENGQCNVEEMTLMIEELERLNMDCDNVHGSSRECLLDAVEARNILKVALASHVAHMEQAGVAAAVAKKRER